MAAAVIEALLASRVAPKHGVLFGDGGDDFAALAKFFELRRLKRGAGRRGRVEISRRLAGQSFKRTTPAARRRSDRRRRSFVSAELRYGRGALARDDLFFLASGSVDVVVGEDERPGFFSCLGGKKKTRKALKPGSRRGANAAAFGRRGLSGRGGAAGRDVDIPKATEDFF